MDYLERYFTLNRRLSRAHFNLIFLALSIPISVAIFLYSQDVNQLITENMTAIMDMVASVPPTNQDAIMAFLNQVTGLILPQNTLSAYLLAFFSLIMPFATALLSVWRLNDLGWDKRWALLLSTHSNF